MAETEKIKQTKCMQCISLLFARTRTTHTAGRREDKKTYIFDKQTNKIQPSEGMTETKKIKQNACNAF